MLFVMRKYSLQINIDNIDNIDNIHIIFNIPQLKTCGKVQI